MKRMLALTTMFLAIMLITTSTSLATSFLQVGDQIRVYQSGDNHPNGGEFDIYNAANNNTYIFSTFCAEYSEHLNLGATYRVDSIGTQAIAGNGNSLTEQEAYLMTQYWAGNYAVQSYSDLQLALWHFQGWVQFAGVNNFFVQAANFAVDNNLWSGIGDIRVANLVNFAGLRVQDIYTRVPEPTTLLLLGISTLGLGLLRRKIGS